ncbi:MAG: glycosyltransferase [Acidobacteriaceae bacterium]|nr:glycosyltransferase [Acidobacteriaceae bacterium]
MRILFICPHQVWPPVTGARLRNLHLSAALARRTAVTLMQLRAPGEEVSDSAELRSFERIVTLERERSYTAGKIIRGLLGPEPLPVLNYRSENVARSLRRILLEEPFDAVQLEGLHLLPYLNTVKELPDPPAILIDWHNIESELMRRYAAGEKNWPKKLVARRTAVLLEQAEARLLSGARLHTVASDRERDALLTRSSQSDVRVLPNGVDVSRFARRQQQGERAGAAPSLLFVGSMDYHANIDGVTWFTKQVWPDLHARFPDVTFSIVGREPGPGIRGLASESVRVTGTVEDVLPFYERAFAVIVPLRVGGGTRLKILEAMAAGVPVISTYLGAEGLDVHHERDILLADSPAEIISAFSRLRADERLWSELAENGFQLVRQKYDWESLGEQLYSMHQQQVAVAST